MSSTQQSGRGPFGFLGMFYNIADFCKYFVPIYPRISRAKGIDKRFICSVILTSLAKTCYNPPQCFKVLGAIALHRAHRLAPEGVLAQRVDLRVSSRGIAVPRDGADVDEPFCHARHAQCSRLSRDRIAQE